MTFIEEHGNRKIGEREEMESTETDDVEATPSDSYSLLTKNSLSDISRIKRKMRFAMGSLNV